MSRSTTRGRALAAVTLALAGAGVAAPAASALSLSSLPSIPAWTFASPRTCTDAPTQAFADYGDDRGYVQIPGGDFSDTTGWQLSSGASVVRTTQRDGTSGRVLSLPPGATALSPQFCVDLRYASARAFVRGSDGVPAQAQVDVLTPAGSLLGAGVAGGTLVGAADWAPSDDVSADPRFAGDLGRYRSVAFRLRNTSDAAIQVDDVLLDPRMR